MKISIKLIISSIAIAIIVAGGTYVIFANSPDKPGVAEVVYQASFPDLQDKTQALAQWQGKVMVLNFWATWCPPCIAEIPEFIKFQKQYDKQGVQFVGIAIDQKDKVQTFVTDMGINYPVLLGEMAGMDLARQLGNADSGLPYTVIIDRSGNIMAMQLGMLSREKLEGIIKPLL